MNIIEELIKDGAYLSSSPLVKSDCEYLFEKMITVRDFGPELFLTEEEYLKKDNHLGSNPTKEFNFLHKFKDELAFLDKHKIFKEDIPQLLGDDYESVINKAVCGVPEKWLPEWVKDRIEGVNVANLGPYIKAEYRDITYFRGIDFHQDIIDWPQGSVDLDPSTFVTVYIYLHPVSEKDAPLHLMPKSHKLGATLFPHKLEKLNNQKWQYENDNNDKIIIDDIVLTGETGFIGLWHNCTLHGTQPVKNESDNFRLSLRFLLGKSNKNKNEVGIDIVNKTIKGDLKPIRTRKDLDEKGKAILKGNTINNY